MENQQIAEVVKKFDNFVHFSLTRKDEPCCIAPVGDNKVESYLKEMEKRLKLRPRSHEQKFEKLLKPMKNLKSFVSVKEFMESLGGCAVGVVGERGVEREEKALKVGY
jgi:hypothetical protein